jgi:hypothetical protein
MIDEKKVNAVENTGDNATGDENETPDDEKKRKSVKTFDLKLNTMKSSLHISVNEPEFRQFIEFYGYDSTRIQVGLGKIDATWLSSNKQATEKARQHQATLDADKKREKADATYMRCIASARLAFKDNPKAFELLKLNGDRQRTFGGWAGQATRFYDNALDSQEYLAELAKYNVPRELLETGKQEVLEAMAADEYKISAKGDAEHATQLKNEAYDDLMAWMKDFYNIVEMAYKKNPQLKEKVRIVVPYNS